MRRRPDGQRGAGYCWAALASALLALGAYRLSLGAVGVVLDPRPAGVVLGVVAFGLSLLGFGDRSGRLSSRRHRAAGVAALVTAVVALELLAGDLLLSHRSEEVGFASDVTLAGTLYLPARRGEPPFPAVVVTHGSGKQSRDEGAFYARMFARHGIAALAYDKRGSGESGGDVETATYEELAGDALAAMRYLRERPEIDGERIGFKGTSEGGWVVSIAAARDAGTAFVVLVSSTAATPAEQVRHEVGERVRRAGYPAEVAAAAAELYGGLSQFERTGEGREALDAALREAAGEPWFETASYLPDSLPTYDEVERLAWFPAWRSRMDFDAGEHLRRVRCPVLLLLGGRDPKIDSARAIATIREALLAGGNRGLTVRVFPDAEHGLVEWYLPWRLPPPRFPSGYPELMAEWILTAVRWPPPSGL